MRSRRRGGWRGIVALVGAVGATALLPGCAPALAPAPIVTTPRHPDFVFPAPPAALARRDLVLRQQRGWQFLQAGDLRGARREFGAALRSNAGFYPAEAGLAYTSLAERSFADAIARFDSVLRRVPAYVPALVGRGDALAGAGRVDEAAASFHAALAEDPGLADVRRRLDVLALRTQQESLIAARRAAEAGRHDEAREAYTRAIASSPDSAFLYRELAGVERRQGRSDAALAHLRKATALDPADARGWVLLGEVLEERGEFAEAAGVYAKAQAIDPAEETAARLAAARSRAEMARLPEQYRSIASAPAISRGDLAALIGVRLAAVLPTAERPASVVTDVRGHWASPWIMTVLGSGVMEAYPNHTFQPRTIVRRLDMARVVARVLQAIASRRPPASARAWTSQRPSIADLPPAHLGYPAAAAAVASGVMPLDDGLFRPTRPVSGAEAIAVIERLEGHAR
jgi:tetratricopeptide (TPR) repeat protein